MKRLISILAVTAALAYGQAPLPGQTGSQPTNIELTVYLLSGVAQGDTADDVPQDLASTVKQLRTIFNYKSYKLTESFMLRGRLGGGASAQGVLPGGSGIHYEFRYASAQASSEASPVIRINGLRIFLTNNYYRRGGDGKSIPDPVASISTDLDIREGQKTVVGKSSMNSTGDALILVIVPKLVQ